MGLTEKRYFGKRKLQNSDVSSISNLFSRKRNQSGQPQSLIDFARSEYLCFLLNKLNIKNGCRAEFWSKHNMSEVPSKVRFYKKILDKAFGTQSSQKLPRLL